MRRKENSLHAGPFVFGLGEYRYLAGFRIAASAGKKNEMARGSAWKRNVSACKGSPSRFMAMPAGPEISTHGTWR